MDRPYLGSATSDGRFLELENQLPDGAIGAAKLCGGTARSLSEVNAPQYSFESHGG